MQQTNIYVFHIVWTFETITGGKEELTINRTVLHDILVLSMWEQTEENLTKYWMDLDSSALIIAKTLPPFSINIAVKVKQYK